MIAKVSHSRWRFAQANELEYQTRKSARLARSGHQLELAAHAKANSESVANYLAELGRLQEDALTVEVGSGASGLIWHWPGRLRVAVDPLAGFFNRNFGSIQPVGTWVIEARGEQLPLADACAGLVLSDNVLDHVEDPAQYLAECRRLLRLGGVLYLRVDVHYPLYWWTGCFYNLLYALGLGLKVPAFPCHPFHFTYGRIQALVARSGLAPLTPLRASRSLASSRGRFLGSRLMALIQAVFYKNMRMELVLERPQAARRSSGCSH